MPPSPSPDQFTVTPGSVGAARTIQEPLLNLQTVYYKSSSLATAAAKTPAHVKLTYSDGTCTDSWYPPLASTMSASNGWLQNPGQPYAPSGTLTVCADYNTATTGTAYWKNTVTTSNTNFSAANLVPTITITKNGTDGSSSGAC